MWKNVVQMFIVRAVTRLSVAEAKYFTCDHVQKHVQNNVLGIDINLLSLHLQNKTSILIKPCVRRRAKMI